MKKVFIGVGHGGSDPGAIANGFKEKDLNLDIALACRDELERHGIVVLLSRIKDEDDPISDEIREANAFKPEIAVDVHNNAGSGKGFEVYYRINDNRSKQLAECIEGEVKSVGQNSRGIKTRARSDGQDYYGFIRQIKATTTLCEFAFVDNPKDMEILDTPQKRRIMGEALAKGILRYIGVAWIPPIFDEWYIWVGKFKSEDKAKEYSDMISKLPGQPYNEIRRA